MDLPVTSLPPAVVETYHEYKRRQKILVAWLCQQGQSCNTQKNCKAELYDTKLSISEFERLTADVAAQKSPIPEDIIYAARTMLKMRKEVALYYQDAEEGH